MGILSRIFGSKNDSSSKIKANRKQPMTSSNHQPLSEPIIDCKCDKCGDVNWGRPDGGEIDIESDWLNLHRVLMCLSCGRTGIIDANSHKQLAASIGINVPDQFLRIGYSAYDYLESVKRQIRDE